VPWRETFSFVDPATGQDKRGWFRCPCHGSTYNDAGVRVFGPAPRSMDRMQLTIDPSSGRISVNTGSITKGTPDNNKFAVQP
jgi:cytochrome b6-f complex iron-sulfur subunit